MIYLLMHHWSTYVYLSWLLVVVIGNLWPRPPAQSHCQESDLSSVSCASRGHSPRNAA
jgi:hypothetical protein